MSEATEKVYERALALPFYGSLRVISKLCGSKQEVLDVGCASGYLGRTLIPRGNVMYGIDGNQEATVEAKRLYHDAVCLDLNMLSEQILFGGKKFDVIIFADVLEHLLDPRQTLKYFDRLLKPGGRIIVSLPNVALWRVRLNLLFGHFDYADYGVLDRTHLHLYTFKTARELIENAGYTVLSSRPAMNFYFFGLMTDLFPWLRSLFGIHIIMEGKHEESSRLNVTDSTL